MPSGKARKFAAVIDEKRSYEDWSLVWVPARKNQEDLSTCWNRVMEEAFAASEAGAHLFAYHRAVSERGRYEKAVRFRHRLIWLDHSCLYPPSTDEWWLEIEERLRLEDGWRRRIRPTSHHHALILPSRTFQSSLDPWTTAQRAETERACARAQAEIDAFGGGHRYQGKWRDHRSLLFDSGGANHGNAPEDRRWKFTFQLPSGFHFDVTHERGQQFSLVDAGGRRHRFRKYTNVDAHGHIRGGE